MDVVTNIPINIFDNCDSLHLADLTKDEHNLLVNHVALTRDVIEANQLFEVFYFNLLNMRNSLTFKINDTVTLTEYCPDCDLDFIAVNSMVINFISSTKTLTEFLRDIANKWLGNSAEKKDKYKDKYNIYVSKIYDEFFNYRFLINLRNYMQHGYLPVSFKEGRYSFDFKQILDTPHFDIKGQLKTDIDNFLAEFETPGENIPCMSLTITISDFTVKTIGILFYIKKCVSSSFNKVKKLIKNKPSIVCDYHEILNGYIIYDMDEYRYHAFNSNDNPNQMMYTFEKRVSYIYEEEKGAYDELRSHFTFCKDINL